VLDETTVPEVSENDGTDQDAENEKGDFPGDFRLGFGTLNAVKKHVFCMLRLFLPVSPGPDTLVLDAKSTAKFRVVESWVLSRCTSGVFDHSPARVAQQGTRRPPSFVRPSIDSHSNVFSHLQSPGFRVSAFTFQNGNADARDRDLKEPRDGSRSVPALDLEFNFAVLFVKVEVSARCDDHHRLVVRLGTFLLRVYFVNFTRVISEHSFGEILTFEGSPPESVV